MSAQHFDDSEFQDNDGDAASLHDFELEDSSSDDESHTSLGSLGDLQDVNSQPESEEEEDVPRVSSFTRGRNFQPRAGQFVPQPFIAFGITDETSPLEILQTLLTDDIITSIVEQTNLYVTQLVQANARCLKRWRDLDANECWRFIALSLMMGQVQKHSIRDYWITDELFETPAFGKIMSRNR